MLQIVHSGLLKVVFPGTTSIFSFQVSDLREQDIKCCSCYSPKQDQDQFPSSHSVMHQGSSETEKNLLLELILKNKNVVQDDTTNLSKRLTKETWSGITERFNASGIGPPKTTKQLKLMWCHIRKK